MILKVREQTIEFLRSRCWCLTEGVTIPTEVDEWATREEFGKNEDGYLVKLNGQYGYIYIEEYAHDEQTNGFDKEFVLEHNLICSEIMKKLNEKAEKLSPLLEESILVMVGEKTGFMGYHEFCIFFPFGADRKIYQETLNKFLQVEQTVA